MASINNLSLLDGSTTPVARVFTPRSNNDGTVTYVYDAIGAPALAGHIAKIKTKAPPSPDGYTHVDLLIEVPTVDAPAASGGYTPIPRKVGSTRVTVSYKLNGAAAIIDRAHVHKYLVSLLSDPQVLDAVLLLTPPR